MRAANIGRTPNRAVVSKKRSAVVLDYRSNLRSRASKKKTMARRVSLNGRLSGFHMTSWRKLSQNLTRFCSLILPLTIC